MSVTKRTSSWKDKRNDPKTQSNCLYLVRPSDPKTQSNCLHLVRTNNPKNCFTTITLILSQDLHSSFVIRVIIGNETQGLQILHTYDLHYNTLLWMSNHLRLIHQQTSRLQKKMMTSYYKGQHNCKDLQASCSQNTMYLHNMLLANLKRPPRRSTICSKHCKPSIFKNDWSLPFTGCKSTKTDAIWEFTTAVPIT